MQEEKEHWKMILKSYVAIFVYANEEMWLLGTAGPPSYVQAHLYVSIYVKPQSYTQEQLFLCVYVKFCARAMCTFGARE